MLSGFPFLHSGSQAEKRDTHSFSLFFLNTKMRRALTAFTSFHLRIQLKLKQGKLWVRRVPVRRVAHCSALQGYVSISLMECQFLLHLYPDDAMPLLHKVSIHMTGYQKELASPHCCFWQSAPVEHKTVAHHLLREALLYKASRYFTLLQNENHRKHYVSWTFRKETQWSDTESLQHVTAARA